jgi:hypothetical protein
MHKAAIPEVKNPQLFKGPHGGESVGPLTQKHQQSIVNQTKFLESKVTLTSKAFKDTSQEEQDGWICKSPGQRARNLYPGRVGCKGPGINIPIPHVLSIIWDLGVAGEGCEPAARQACMNVEITPAILGCQKMK